MPDTISGTRLHEYFGFTQEEVNQLLRDTGLTDDTEVIKEWYDGYHFGDFDVYCPWDVMNHVERLMLDPGAKPAGYWKNSSDNGIIRSFIDVAGDTITKKLETLLSGGYVVEKVEEDLTYQDLLSSEANLWSMLYLTGYLTPVREERLQSPLPEDCVALGIPNREIREDFYHAFFAGIFAGAGYAVESNREHGEGRSDIVVQDYSGDRAAVFEIKYAGSQEGLQKSCEEAVAQIDDRMYGEVFQDDYSRVICYGVAFYKKRCLVKCKECL